MTGNIIELRQNQLQRAVELVNKYRTMLQQLESGSNQYKEVEHLLIKLNCLCDCLRRHISELHGYNTISDKMKEL